MRHGRQKSVQKETMKQKERRRSINKILPTNERNATGAARLLLKARGRCAAEMRRGLQNAGATCSSRQVRCNDVSIEIGAQSLVQH